MDSIEGRAGLKGLFAQKDGRALLYYYRYNLGRYPVNADFLAEVLGVKPEVARDRLRLLQRMDMARRLESPVESYRFEALANSGMMEMLEEFFKNRSVEYEQMARAFSSVEVRTFLGSEVKDKI